MPKKLTGLRSLTVVHKIVLLYNSSFLLNSDLLCLDSGFFTTQPDAVALPLASYDSLMILSATFMASFTLPSAFGQDALPIRSSLGRDICDR